MLRWRRTTYGVCIAAAALLTGCSATSWPGKEPAIQGNCNVHGNNNTVNCSTQVSPTKIGHIEIDGFKGTVFLFDGRPSDLPIPPQYPKDEAAWHCGAWERWLSTDPKVYTTNPGGALWAVSGKTEQVAVMGYRVELYARKPLKESNATYIVCSHGGGGDPGYILDWNTVTERATLVDFTGKKKKTWTIPPASINVAGRGFNGILLNITSQSHYLYSGRVVLTAVINGKKKTVSIGSKKNPHRWVGGDSPEGGGDSAMWDWNPVNYRWVKNFDPFSI